MRLDGVEADFGAAGSVCCSDGRPIGSGRFPQTADRTKRALDTLRFPAMVNASAAGLIRVPPVMREGFCSSQTGKSVHAGAGQGAARCSIAGRQGGCPGSGCRQPRAEAPPASRGSSGIFGSAAMRMKPGIATGDRHVVLVSFINLSRNSPAGAYRRGPESWTCSGRLASGKITDHAGRQTLRPPSRRQAD